MGKRLILIIFLSLARFSWASEMTEIGTTVRCNDAEIQAGLRSLQPAVSQIKPVVFKKLKKLDSRLYEILDSLSVANFGKVITTLDIEFFAMGPNIMDDRIRFNPQFLDFLKTHAQYPQQVLQFHMAHELAHQVQGLYNRHVEKTQTMSGYTYSRLKGDFEREVFPHAQVDCIAMSLMKNAKMKMNVEQAEESQRIIRDECVEYRGAEFCYKAYDTRLEHMKKWLESNEYRELIPL